MERSLKNISLCRLGNRPVTMQIAEPFAKIFVGEMFIRPVTDQPVTLKVFLVAGSLISIKRSNNRLTLRPPELHVL